jgi:hypothetical protein
MERTMYSAYALIKADQFITALEEMRKSGEAVKYRGKPENVPIGSRLAVVTIDDSLVHELLGEEYGISKHELTLGVLDEIGREELVYNRKYMPHEGENFERETKLTDWTPHWKQTRYSLGFGGYAWSKDPYVISFIPKGKIFVPPTYDSETVKNALNKCEGFSGKFTVPSSFGDQTLAKAAKGLKRCIEGGVILNPMANFSNWHSVFVGSYVDKGVYTVSQKGFSRLEAICSREY